MLATTGFVDAGQRVPLTTTGSSGNSVELCIAIDGSGSILSSDFTLQKEGLASALDDPLIIPRDGQVSLAVVQFDSIARLELPLTSITSASQAQTLAQTIRGITQLGGLTDLAVALDLCADTFTYAADSQVIGFATDGAFSLTEANASADAAIGRGVDEIDAIGVGGSINQFQLESVVRPQPSNLPPDPGFVVFIGDFTGFGRAIEAMLDSVVEIIAITPIDPGTSPGERFGEAVDVDGTLVAFGVPGSDGGRGKVLLYRREGDALVPDGELGVPAEFFVEGLGTALALSGDTLVAGAPDSSVAAAKSGLKGLNPIQAAIFQRLQQGWRFKAPIMPANGHSGDGFGSAVAIDGSRVVVGAPGDDEGEGGSGAAYLFEVQPDRIVQRDKRKPTGPSGKGAAGLRYGAAVAMQNGKLAIGMPGLADGALFGSVEVFDAVDSSLGAPGRTLVGRRQAGDRFGASLAVSGSSVLVGAPEEDDAGAAYVYPGSSPGRRLPPSNPVSGGRHGWSVDIHIDAIVVGAPGGIVGAKGLAPGTVSRYRLEAGTANLVSVTGAPAGSASFGNAVAIAGNVTVIGAPDTNTGSGSGAVISDPRAVFDNSFEGGATVAISDDILFPPTACGPGRTRKQVLFFDDMESGSSGWTVNGLNPTWHVQSGSSSSGFRAWRAIDEPFVTDQVLATPVVTLPVLDVDAGEGFRVSWMSRRIIESVDLTSCFDGGVIETASPDQSFVFTFESGFIVEDPYTGPIVQGFSNPLEGFDAWCGVLPSWQRSAISFVYPALTEPLNQVYRFRLATDSSVGAEGWYIDDVMVESCE